LVFASGFTVFPVIISIPVMLFRGLTIGYVLKCITLSSYVFVSIVSYFTVTLFLLFLSLISCRFSKEYTVSRYRSVPRFTYSFLLISGASVITKIIPAIITEKLI